MWFGRKWRFGSRSRRFRALLRRKLLMGRRFRGCWRRRKLLLWSRLRLKRLFCCRCASFGFFGRGVGRLGGCRRRRRKRRRGKCGLSAGRFRFRRRSRRRSLRSRSSRGRGTCCPGRRSFSMIVVELGIALVLTWSFLNLVF